MKLGPGDHKARERCLRPNGLVRTTHSGKVARDEKCAYSMHDSCTACLGIEIKEQISESYPERICPGITGLKGHKTTERHKSKQYNSRLTPTKGGRVHG